MELLFTKLNELYIAPSTGKILAKSNYNSYSTKKITCTYGNMLNEYMSRNLLGVFSTKNRDGVEVSKFFTLDFDFENLTLAQQAVTKTIQVMEDVFGFDSDDNYLINFSGKKGYHLTIFFDDYVSLKLLKNYYKIILFETGYSPSNIEFRPTYNQGVKLPLVNHPVTNLKAHFVNENFEPITDMAIFKVKPLNREDFADMVMSIFFNNYDKNKDFKILSKTVKVTGNLSDTFDKIQFDTHQNTLSNASKAEMILAMGSFVGKRTRHANTLLLSTYFSSMKVAREVAEEKLIEIINNSYMNENFITTSSKAYAIKEALRLIDYAYDNNLSFNKKLGKVKLYKEELDVIFTLKDARLRSILLVLLLHGKIHNAEFGNNGEFFCSYRQLQDYGISLSFDKIKEAYNELELLGFIKVTNRNELRKTDSLTGFKATTRFVVNIRKNKGTDYINLDCKQYNLANLQVEDFLVQFYTTEELKGLYSKSTFYRKVKNTIDNFENILGITLCTIKKALTAVTENNIAKAEQYIQEMKNRNLTLAENPLKKNEKKKNQIEKVLAKNLEHFLLALLYPKIETTKIRPEINTE